MRTAMCMALVCLCTTAGGSALYGQTDRQWGVPHVGLYVRSFFGLSIEAGVRGGGDIYRGVAGVTGEVGLLLARASPNGNPLKLWRSVRMDIAPLPGEAASLYAAFGLCRLGDDDGLVMAAGWRWPLAIDSESADEGNAVELTVLRLTRNGTTRYLPVPGYNLKIIP